MGGINGINPIYSGYLNQVTPSGAATGKETEPIRAGQLAQTGQLAGGSSILSLSSTSLSATSETLMAGNMPMLATNEAIGAALLLLILQYLQTSDSKEKQNLTDMIVALAGMQQQNAGGEMLLYSSSSLSIESTQLTIATSQGLGAYSGAAASLQQAPPGDPGSPALDVSA
jgi:hypothetical protein